MFVYLGMLPLFIYFTNLARNSQQLARSQPQLQYALVNSHPLSEALSPIEAGRFSNSEIATVAHTTDRTIRRIRRNIRIFGQASAPANNPGRPAIVRSQIVDALLDHLTEKPELYLEEIAWIIWDEFNEVVSTSAI
jgi:hypothetical protein